MVNFNNTRNNMTNLLPNNLGNRQVFVLEEQLLEEMITHRKGTNVI